jgi:hypothetical protein
MLRVKSSDVSCKKYVEAMENWWDKSNNRNREP